MDNIENKVNVTKDDHVCEHGKCSCCGGCNLCSMSMKHYMGRRFLVLVFAVLIAFFVGMRVGVIKGFVMSNYGVDSYKSGWMMNR